MLRDNHRGLSRRICVAGVLAGQLILVGCIAGFIVGSTTVKAVVVVLGIETVVGAWILRLCSVIRVARLAQRDRLERATETMRRASVELLRAVVELRVRIVGTTEYHGGEMGARLAEIREYGTAVELYTVNLGLLAPHDLAASAKRLAGAANRLVVAAAENMACDLGVMVRTPDFDELDASSQIFRESVLESFQSPAGRRSTFPRRMDQVGGPGRAMRLSSKLMPAEAGKRWFSEAQSVLFEARPEQRSQVIRNYLLTAAHVIATTWACELSRRARLVYSRRSSSGNRDDRNDTLR
jgi:hypothetical protein